MVKTKHTEDDLTLKSVEKKRKLKRWVIILLCLAGLIAVIILVVIKLENLYTNDGYTKDFENNFIASCKSRGSSTSECECFYGVLKQNYTFNQIKEFDRDTQSIGTKLVLDKIIGECKTK